MNSIDTINWQSFKDRLQENTEKVLQFEYAEGKMVDASYHITEIKQAPVVSVDCGGMINSWTEVIIQLWEPPVMETNRAMKAEKALSIITMVEKMLPLNPLGTVKIEFGNPEFGTRQMFPGHFVFNEDSMTVVLAQDFTQCKAMGRNEVCGISPKSETRNSEISGPVNILIEESGNAVCGSGSGCC